MGFKNKRIWVSGLAALAVSGGVGASGVAPSLGPCGDVGREWIRDANRFSQPAGGNIDALPAATEPIPDRLRAIDSPNLHGDQCRAVLGPIPRFTCSEGFLLPVSREGKRITYEHGVLAVDGTPTSDQEVLNGCDAPALLPYLLVNPARPGGRGKHATEGCLPNVRVGRVRSGPVDWVFLCHWHSGLHERDDLFDFVTLIGSNANTGETCFLGHDQFPTPGIDLVPPGGSGPDDRKGREEAGKFWNHPTHNTCLRCHSGNKAWTITPHLNQTRVGGDGSMDFMPSVPLSQRLTPGWGFRVIGTVHNLVMDRPKAIWPKNDDGTTDRTCTRCHLVTDREENLRLSRDAVGLPDLRKYADRGVPHSTKPWMPSGHFGEWDTAKYQAAVRRLERAVFDPRFRAEEKEILSRCPAPGDLSGAAVRVGAGGVRWTYRNDYGGVASRDDIRFQVEIEGSDGSSCRFRDIAPQSLGSSQWAFSHPTQAGVRYSYRLLPYRYCFDQEGYRNGTELKVSAAGRPLFDEPRGPGDR